MKIKIQTIIKINSMNLGLLGIFLQADLVQFQSVWPKFKKNSLDFQFWRSDIIFMTIEFLRSFIKSIKDFHPK